MTYKNPFTIAGISLLVSAFILILYSIFCPVNADTKYDKYVGKTVCVEMKSEALLRKLITDLKNLPSVEVVEETPNFLEYISRDDPLAERLYQIHIYGDTFCVTLRQVLEVRHQ